MNITSPYWFIAPNGGRLGNKLFQLAAVYTHCLRNKRACCMNWNTNALTKALGAFLRYPVYQTNYSGRLVYDYKVNMEYKPIPNDLPSGAIGGLFISPKYWQPDCEKLVRWIYRRFVHPEKAPHVAAVHIRLGDYLTGKRKGMYYVTTDDYLRNAIDMLSPDIEEVMLFSDDPWDAHKMFSKVAPLGRFKDIRTTVPPEDDPYDPINTLREMTRYNEFIMSASTLSWWGAFLGKAQNVIVPDKWFLKKDIPCEDVFIPEWKRL